MLGPPDGSAGGVRPVAEGSSYQEQKRDLGRAIRRARQAAGFTHKTLAEAVGVTLNYVGLIERGKANPTLSVVAKICEACGTHLQDIFEAPKEKVRYSDPVHQDLHDGLQRYLDEGDPWALTTLRAVIYGLDQGLRMVERGGS